MRKLGIFKEMKVWRHGRCSLTTPMGWVWAAAVSAAAAEAESMTGWLTAADVGGGGATSMSSRKRAVGMLPR
jgi:hypothetical protein